MDDPAPSLRAKSPRWIKRQIDEGSFGKLVNAEANISRDRLGKIDLGSWRYQAAGMPGGVMLQIGIHYADVLEYLMGPIVAVSGRLAQLVLPGDNPDVASLVLEHESGALSTLNASYASASEYYQMNIYGKAMTDTKRQAHRKVVEMVLKSNKIEEGKRQEGADCWYWELWEFASCSGTHATC